MNTSFFAACLHIRNLALCGMLTVALSACDGGSDGSSSSASASTGAPSSSLVSPSVGFIDRTSTTTDTAAQQAANSSSSESLSVTPVSDTPASGSGGTTTVASNGAATLDWTPPTQNSDGSVLTDLAGYTVYYGTSPDSLNQKLKITNAGLSAYTMTNLPAGTWYFAITSTSSSGSESALSAVISAKI